MYVEPLTTPTSADVLQIVSVAELKLNMRITHSVENDIFEACILAAYDFLAGREGWLNRPLITQSYKMTLPGWQKQQVYTVDGGPATRWVPTTEIELPMPPLVGVTTVKYLVDGAQQTLAADQYVVLKRDIGWIYKANGVTWPTGIDTHPEAVEIVFTAGYGTPADVKKLWGIVQAIKLLAGDAYRNREDTYAEPRLVMVNRQAINGFKRFAGRYRIMNNYA